MKLPTKRAFTIIELIMVIVVLGILSIVAIARYFDITNDAKIAGEKGVVAGIIVSIHAYYAGNKTFPDALDASAGGACRPGNACFTNVLAFGGITEDWTKSGANSYSGPSGRVYTYTKDDGTFR